MAREWNFEHCQRCYKKGTHYIMSMYNEQMICEVCKNNEQSREDYKKACEAEEEAIRQGNFNFKGIGFN